MRRLVRDLCDLDPTVRWAAVRGLGDHASSRWHERPDLVRNLLSRLLWALNDESGATGWGAPEAVGEILARVPELGREFARRLPAWLSHPDVDLGNPVLLAGTLWAMARLGPEAAFDHDDLAGLLRPWLASTDASVRGMAALAAGELLPGVLDEELAALVPDPAPIRIPTGDRVVETTVGAIAIAARSGGPPGAPD